MALNKLEIRWIKRKVGQNQTPTDSIDFLIDGKSLFELLNAEDRDLVGVFSPRWVDNETTAKIFKAEKLSSLKDHRVLVFGCGECCDIGCGGITMSVNRERAPNRIVWRDFAFENDIDESGTDKTCYISIGPFEFEDEDYPRVAQLANESRTSSAK